MNYEDLAVEAGRRLTRVKAGAGVYAGLVALAFGDLSSNLVAHAPATLNAFFATSVVVAGFWLARTYVAFHNCAEHVARLDDTARAADVPSPDEVKAALRAGGSPDSALLAADEYQLGNQVFYRTAITLVVVAGVTFLVAVWVSAFSA